MEKGIRNIYTITYKLGPALKKVTNQKLEIIKEEKQKREKIVKKQKAESIAAK